MTSKASRVQNLMRPRTPDRSLQYAVLLLNGEDEVLRHRCDHQALAELVAHLRELDKAWSEPVGRYRPHEGIRYSTPAVLRAWKTIQATLNQYTAVPSLTTTPLHGENRGEQWQLEWRRVDGQSHWDLRWALLVVEIFLTGRIGALKQCEQCGKWLLARFRHQRFCPGSECQQDFHKFNEADKKRRRDWARKNYQSRKELELGSRKAAQQKRGKK